jgi:K+-sensing histidine kinase KdpD
MLARQHKLKVGQVGIVGYAAAAGQSRIALDVGQDAVYFDNPDLPETRSEMALPLKIQNQVIGVLDVQSTEPSAFSEEDIAVLQILADQIALAIEDARLIRESRQAFEDVNSLYGSQMRASWQKYSARHFPNGKFAYLWGPTGAQPLSKLTHTKQEEVKSIGTNDKPDNASIAQDNDELLTIKAPIELRGQRLGDLVLKRQKDQPPWSQEEKALIEQTISQVALALESARLYEDTRRRAERERLTSEIITKVRASNDPQVILQTAVGELRRALQASRAQALVTEKPKRSPDGTNPQKPVGVNTDPKNNKTTGGIPETQE